MTGPHNDGNSPAPTNSGPGRPRKRRAATTEVTIEDFESDDEVRNLTAIKKRLAEMLARPDLHERDLTALSRDYRKVIVELQEAQLRAEAKKIGTSGRPGLRAVDLHRFDGDI